MSESKKRPMGTKVSVNVNGKTFWWYLGVWYVREPDTRWIEVRGSA